MQQCWKGNKEDRPDFSQILTALEMLSKSPWTHLLFEISEKRRSYVDENQHVFLFPPPTQVPTTKKKALLNNGRRIFSSTPQLIGDMSGFTSDASSESPDMGSGITIAKGGRGSKPPARKKLTTDDASQLLVSQKNQPNIEELERELLTPGGKIERTNPLISTNIL